MIKFTDEEVTQIEQSLIRARLELVELRQALAEKDAELIRLMTRKELLTARASEVVETALSREVCLSEAECTIVREVVLFELMRVEREVWGKVEKRYHCHEYMSDHRTFDEWLTTQQQEVG